MSAHVTRVSHIQGWGKGEDWRTFFFEARSGRIVLTRLRLLITSVFSEMGRGRPCNLRKSPHALHRTEPNSSRRQSGVVDVVQFWQTGCEDVLVAIILPVALGEDKGGSREQGRGAINNFIGIVMIDKDDGAKKSLDWRMRRH